MLYYTCTIDGVLSIVFIVFPLLLFLLFLSSLKFDFAFFFYIYSYLFIYFLPLHVHVAHLLSLRFNFLAFNDCSCDFLFLLRLTTHQKECKEKKHEIRRLYLVSIASENWISDNAIFFKLFFFFCLLFLLHRHLYDVRNLNFMHLKFD